MSSIKRKTANGLKWSAIERILTQFVQLIVMLYLARLLGPEAFGLIGMLAIFIAVSQVLIDSGFTSALIRKKDVVDEDFTTAFLFNVVSSLVCYLLLYISSETIAEFFKQPELITLTKVISIVIIINSLTIVQKAMLTIAMDFKTQAKASIISVLISSFVAIIFALNEFGVWSLVAQTITMSICNAIMLNIFCPWKPRLAFSLLSFRYLFNFGSKLLLSGILDTIYKNIYQVIIGKYFNVGQVGQFTQANQVSSVPAITMTSIIQRVTYPMLSKMQGDSTQLESAYLLTLRLAAAVIFPLLFGLAVTAEWLITTILGSEWAMAAELVTILSVGFLLYPIHAINLNLLQVKGRTDLFLKLEVIKKILITVILFITVPLGIKAMCVGLTIHSYIALVINTYYTGKIANLSLKRQIYSLLPIWIISLISCFFGYYVSSIIIDDISIALMLAVSISIIFYALSMITFQADLIKYINPRFYKE
ncbi:lipopolysaccharide biosynthesis protein [Vibrio sp. Isolate34]|uniref:lipopolysaccharide biosynthesis protein n=1 Tax=Vibrio sp. Isolate34 TaxID=2908540 RepID=UPI001EFD7B60|nr:lipopolysaccharide biosynthesis protein [Vibrio sp. Isolate34]MCG9639522.1 lipopolysaccharide biosynthesis protein [Vibrio sp. Isolate34]